MTSVVDLVAALRAHPLMAGIEVLDWRVNGKGDPDYIGVMNHHTVSRSNAGRYPSRTVVTEGRPDVSGPLCNILGARGGGSVAVITDEEANHAGAGDPNVTARAKANQPAGGKPGPDRNGADGRHWWLGIEWENDGTGEPWAPSMIDTMHRTNAALCDIFGWDPMTRVVQHSEWSRRKIDCAFITPRITYEEFRRDIAALLNAPPPPEAPHTPEQEWDEMATKQEIIDAVTEGAALAVMAITGDEFEPAKIRDADVFNLRDLSAEVRAGVLAVGVQVIQHVAAQQGVDVDPAKVADAVSDELARRLGA